ncbi:MAG TPA: DNA gyrase inhibitor YacG [Rhizomicrobium sp.]|nr:DNA gyrase inhibitor YacG [Rhizomicrobium sp.]
MAECPICHKPESEGFKPFCSKRCADIDLGRWLKGGYAIPGAPADPASPSNPSEKDADEA